MADGRKAVHPRMLDVLSTLGVYQEGVATNQVGDKDVQAHLFEHTTQNSMTSDRKLVGLENGIMPCQVMFCLKEKSVPPQLPGPPGRAAAASPTELVLTRLLSPRLQERQKAQLAPLGAPSLRPAA